MNVNVNLLPRKKGFFKKIIILILFTLLCFFIKENVFALEVPSFLENYTDYRVSCNADSDICLSETTHTFKSFIEYYVMPTHPYILITQFTSDIGTDNWFYMFYFSLKPYIQCNSSYCYFYTTPKADEYSYFYMTSSNIPQSSDGLYYLNFDNATSNPNASKEDRIVLWSERMSILYSNFDLQDINEDIVFSNNSTGTSDWTNTDDITTDDRNWLEKLFDNITDGFYYLGKFFTELPETILDTFKSLFIPGDELEGFFEEEYDYIKKQLGFLAYPIEIVIDFANRFYALDNTNSAVFKIPKLEIFNKTIYEGTEFDLMSIVNENEAFKNIYNIYKIAISGFIVLWLVQLAIKKEHEIFGGGIE